MENSKTPLTLDEDKVIEGIRHSHDSTEIVSTILKTDARVIARVTDGIYRQPGSAIRELISNAYDADATRVVIKTDAPRFERISIEDNGHGMTPEALAHMLFHIGGSAKRQEVGKSLGITNNSNSLLSPSGRKLIGKIGIGIFSVAQLTHSFQIITKTKGDDFRTIATVALKQYSDEAVQIAEQQHADYESGKVNIWREKAKDTESHGTTIILTTIRPQARDTLRSREMWAAIEESIQNQEEFPTIEPPKYHVGKVDASGMLLTKFDDTYSSVPWNADDEPEDAFKKLVQSVWDELSHSNPNPQLDKLFDYYLQMVWQISLSVPLPYIEGHLFDINLNDGEKTFLISNTPKGSAREISFGEASAREVLALEEGKLPINFDVYFDELKLTRPIKYKHLPTTDHAIKYPLIFFGKCKEEFKNYSIDLSGGTLEFEAYLFWNPKVAPAEHRGSLIRINGASGTLFDSSFMRYQVSEQTRLRQIVCEIFIMQGFDSALNIDREAFNYAHPHAVFLTRWLHSALRQLATAQKNVASKIRVQERSIATTETVNEIQEIVKEVWKEEVRDQASFPPSIEIVSDEPRELFSQKRENPEIPSITYTRSDITSKKDKIVSKPNLILDEKLKAIVQVLASFHLLDNLNHSQQNRLLKAIYKILETNNQ